MNDNIEFNNDNIDIFSIIEKILNKKFVVFTFVFIGTLFGYLFFNDQEKSYNNILKFDLKEISSLEKKIIYSSSFIDFGLATFLTPELQNFSNSTYFIDSLTSKDNIKKTLLDQNVSENKILEVGLIDNIIKQIEIKKNIDNGLGEHSINFKSNSINEKIFDEKNFLQTLIINAHKITYENAIFLIKENLFLLDSLIILDNEYSKFDIDINNTLGKINLDNELNTLGKINLDNELEKLEKKYLFDIKLLNENITIAKNLGYIEPYFTNELYDIKSSTLPISKDANSIESGVYYQDTASNIFSLSKATGIPMYMFGYKLLNAELLSLEKNKLSMFKEAKLHATQLDKKYRLKLFELDNKHRLKLLEEGYISEINEGYITKIFFLKKILNENLDNMYKVDLTNYMIDTLSLDYFESSEIEVDSKPIFTILLFSILSFIFSIFYILYKSEKQRRVELVR